MIYLIPKHCKEITCKGYSKRYDYTTRQYYFTKDAYDDWVNEYALIIADSVEELNSILKKDTISSNIIPGDKLYFTSNSGFPPLLLSRYKQSKNIDIKRTVKLNNDCKIVAKPERLKIDSRYIYTCLYRPDTNELISCGSHWNYRHSLESSDLKDNEYVEFLNNLAIPGEKYKVLQRISDSEYEILQVKLNHYNQIVKDIDVFEYCKKFTDTLNEEDFEYILKMMNSSDSDIVKTVLSSLQHYNLENYILELYLYLKAHWYNVENSTAWKYIMQYVGVDKRQDLRWGYYSYPWKDIMPLLENPLASEISMNKIKEEIKKRIVDTVMQNTVIAEDLKLINCEIKICDKE